MSDAPDTMTESTIHLNSHKHRFELKTDGKLSIIEFMQPNDETLALTHTEVDPSLEGQGIGSKLVEEVLEYAERNNLKIVPLCPFVAAYIKRHPAWQRVVSPVFMAGDF